MKHPSLAAISDQIVSTGDAVSVSSSATEIYNQYFEGYVDWGDGTGLHPTEIGHTLSTATLTANLDAAGDPGQYNASLQLYSVDQPNDHSGLQDSKSFKLDVWGAKLGDGSNNVIMQASDDGTQNLVPLTLYYPRPPGVATSLNLTISNEGEAVVWDTSQPSSGNTPVLSNDDPTVTLDAAAGDYQRTLWVGATEGTTTLNDLTFALAAATPGPTTGPATSATSNPATPISVEIISNNNPNGDDGNNGDVTDKTRNWLVGQMVDLSASIVAPQALLANLTYQWSAPGNVLRSWKVSSGAYTAVNARTNTPTTITEPQMSALNVPLAKDDGAGTGTADQRVEFFWVATKDGIHDDTYAVSLSIKSLGIIESTSFDVFEPVLSSTAVVGPKIMIVDQVDSELRGSGDVVFKASVQTPAAVNSDPGQWSYVQKMNNRSSWTFTDRTRWHIPFPGVWVLDQEFPYDPAFATGSLIQHVKDDPSVTAVTKPDGTQTNLLTELCDFEMYIMFKPYSNPDGDESQWVPLAVSNWTEAGSASFNNHLWTVNASRVTVGQFKTSTVQPQWDVQMDLGKAPLVK